MVLLKLFLSYFKIGLFSFGGGLAMLPFIQEELIEKHGWINPAEFVDMLAISQVTPGPIAINAATFLGFKINGVLGSAVATFSVIFPSFIIIVTIAHFLERFKHSKYVKWVFDGIRPVVLGLIGSALYLVGKQSLSDIKGILIAIAMFYLVGIRKINPMICIVGAGIAGVLLY
ncbi:chromate transporter [Clostridium sp. D2Q-11]|uniref:Chromate transporter n=1 Tax=Anaeromonas frigoriresistens TaxID=2683708 RepID=A0A942Z767_9FIRM|nr:chromate transporter [Anaeromonas frigoriresistens]MBS4538342.1 chromate transporter [Anaeromonas frigoriresistens]